MILEMTHSWLKIMNKKIMLTRFPDASAQEWQDWRWQFKRRIISLTDLDKIIGGVLNRSAKLLPAISSYPMAVTPYYLSLIQPDDENDPLARQCIPDLREVCSSANFADDPLNEDGFMPVPKLIHRYPDRVLAIVTKTCATYCRHCNRKRFWREPDTLSLQTRLEKMERYVAQTPQIREVIISGGDPLIYDDEKLAMILSSFAAIAHVEVLRIGSRMPAVLPMRITKDFCRMLKRFRPLWFNTQFNHPDEITTDAARACNMLLEAGIPVSNQSVLLKGVNDSPEVMQRLLYGLQKISVRPYYLFHCEPVKGCTHFRTDIKDGLEIMEGLRRRSSGLAMPQYVVDLPGPSGKVPVLALLDPLKNDWKKHQDFFDNFQ